MENDRKEDSHPHICINDFETKGQVSAFLSCHLFCEFRPIFESVAGYKQWCCYLICSFIIQWSSAKTLFSELCSSCLERQMGEKPVLVLKELAGMDEPVM